jgi:hypothetical protein
MHTASTMDAICDKYDQYDTTRYKKRGKQIKKCKKNKIKKIKKNFQRIHDIYHTRYTKDMQIGKIKSDGIIHCKCQYDCCGECNYICVCNHKDKYFVKGYGDDRYYIRWNDDYDLIFEEFSARFHKTYKKIIKYHHDQKQEAQRDFIECFCKIIPMYFNMVIHGDAVMSLISGIMCDHIDIVVHNDLVDFMLMMCRLLKSYDSKMTFFCAIKNNQDDETETVVNVDSSFINDYCTEYNEWIIKSFIYCMNNIQIRINVNMRWDRWNPCMGFNETQLMYGKMSNMYIRENESVARSCDSNDICFAMFMDTRFCFSETINDIDIKLIKQNLTNKKLTFCVSDTYYSRYPDVISQITMIKNYYEKSQRGYMITGPCPIGAELYFWFDFKQFDQVIKDVPMNSDVGSLIHSYLTVGDDVCTFCKIPFNKSGRYESMAIIPACECGEKKHQDTTASTLDTAYKRILGGIMYGREENRNNMFHLDCFKSMIIFNSWDRTTKCELCCKDVFKSST